MPNPFPNLARLRPLTDVAWKFWIKDPSARTLHCDQSQQSLITLRNSLIQSLWEGPASPNPAVALDVASLIDGQLIPPHSLYTLFQSAHTLAQLEYAWKCYRVNRINVQEPSVALSDAVVGVSVRVLAERLAWKKHEIWQWVVAERVAQRADWALFPSERCFQWLEANAPDAQWAEAVRELRADFYEVEPGLRIERH